MSQLNLNKSNMSDYSNMSIKDLEELKENLLNQKSNLNNTIEEIINNIRFKKTQANDDTLRLVFQDGNKLFPEEDGCEEVYTHQYDEFISYNEMEEN